MPWAFLFFAESFGMSISVGMCCSAIATNGQEYETFGISKHSPVKLQVLLIWAGTLNNAPDYQMLYI